jgi:hypothetical protein
MALASELAVKPLLAVAVAVVVVVWDRAVNENISAKTRIDATFGMYWPNFALRSPATDFKSLYTQV